MNEGPSELKGKAGLGGKMHPQIWAEIEAKYVPLKIFGITVLMVSHLELDRFLHAFSLC